MDFDFEWQVELGNTAQVFPQDFFLDFELMLVAGVLVVASAAAGEVRARGRDAVRGSLDYCVYSRAREGGLLLGESGVDFFSCQDEGDEHGLAASAIFIDGGSGGVGSGGETGQAVAAVDQLFDCEEQALILRHGERDATHRTCRHEFASREILTPPKKAAALGITP